MLHENHVGLTGLSVTHVGPPRPAMLVATKRAYALVFAHGGDSRARRGVPLCSGGHAPAERGAEPPDDLTGRPHVARAAPGREGGGDRLRWAAWGVFVPAGGAR